MRYRLSFSVGIRHEEGHSFNEGRVEVFLDGAWGSICGYRWSMRSARVVCRMLGMDEPTSATSTKISGKLFSYCSKFIATVA